MAGRARARRGSYPRRSLSEGASLGRWERLEGAIVASHYWLAVLDHSGVLAPADVRDGRSVYWFGSLAAAEGFLAGYAAGRSSLLESVADGAVWVDGAGYGASSGEDGPLLTLWRAATDGAESAHAELLSGGDPYPDRRMSVGARGGVRVVSL